MPLSCSQPGCSYATESVAETLADMLELLRLHTMACHTPTTPASTATRQAQAERIKRPILSLSGKMLDPEEYEHFVYTFRQFKNRLGDDNDGAILLCECLGTDVSRILYSNFGAAFGSFTEEEILTNITKHCVNQQTIQARTTELHREKQEPGQTVSSFLASLKSKARQCDLRIKCDKCQRHCDFSEKIILTLFLKGLQDTDLQQDLLAEQELDLDKCLRIATARETAKRSQDTMNIPTQAVDKISAYKEDSKRVQIPRDCCIGCGKKKHTDKTTCPAKDTVCPCGRTGHFPHLCFRKGKPRKPKKLKQTVEVETEDQSGQTESSNLLSESCFRIQTNDAVEEGDAKQVHEAGQLVVSEVNTEEEESTLNSLWYDDKSAQWKTEISDEETNRLHVVIKPQLEQWSQLSSNPSHLPSRSKCTKAVGIADTGASVLCAGKSIMRRMGVEEKQLVPTTTIIRVANQIKLNVLGMVTVTVQVVGHP